MLRTQNMLRCVKHTSMHSYSTYSGSKHIHSSINMFIIMIHQTLDSKCKCRTKMDKNAYLINISSRNQLRRCNVPPNHRLACSLISQQHCHLRVGHDSPRNKGLSRLTQYNQVNTVGFIGTSRS